MSDAGPETPGPSRPDRMAGNVPDRPANHVTRRRNRRRAPASRHQSAKAADPVKARREREAGSLSFSTTTRSGRHASYGGCRSCRPAPHDYDIAVKRRSARLGADSLRQARSLAAMSFLSSGGPMRGGSPDRRTTNTSRRSASAVGEDWDWSCRVLPVRTRRHCMRAREG